MSINQENAAATGVQGQIDPTTSAHAEGVREPSDVVEPTRVDSPTPQAATQPETSEGTTDTAGSPTWKEQVVGYAKKTRGTLLGKPEVKETGQKIIQGEIPAKQTM
ncbi:hypothetical protein BD410DRAFT_788897 [Rickenella mellea]|uniref:Uncharacterized protein n=1 Tax=Rickenella mellea TaxID=50990 RepID=A0A4Y7Q3F6_9AGAM|nr:hypothetical protein BD410DRAFT_788897 [Rickenella mellea]